MKYFLTVLFTTAILFSAVNLRGVEDNPGKSWLSLSESDRLGWVWGFAQGQELIIEKLQIKSTKNLNFVISAYDAEAISKIMSQYYKDAANTYIDWKYMTVVAKMKLEGKPAVKIEEELELLRSYAAWLRSNRKK
jgi:hypothetical protein